MFLPKERYEALFYTVLLIHTSWQRRFVVDKKLFTDRVIQTRSFSGYLNLGPKSNFSRCYRFLVETYISWGNVIFQAKIALIIHLNIC